MSISYDIFHTFRLSVQLLEAIAPLNRGATASEAEKEQVGCIASMLAYLSSRGSHPSQKLGLAADVTMHTAAGGAAGIRS
jgi:hypothetical protein